MHRQKNRREKSRGEERKKGGAGEYEKRNCEDRGMRGEEGRGNVKD